MVVYLLQQTAFPQGIPVRMGCSSGHSHSSCRHGGINMKWTSRNTLKSLFFCEKTCWVAQPCRRNLGAKARLAHSVVIWLYHSQIWAYKHRTHVGRCSTTWAHFKKWDCTGPMEAIKKNEKLVLNTDLSLASLQSNYSNRWFNFSITSNFSSIKCTVVTYTHQGHECQYWQYWANFFELYFI